MPNIKQQKKRVRTAAQERLENLRFSSTAKTLRRRLEAAVADGDEDRVAEEHKQLVSWLDRAAARGALHKNTAARRKSQADRLVVRRPLLELDRGAGVTSTSARSSSSSPDSRLLPLSARSSSARRTSACSSSSGE